MPYKSSDYPQVKRAAGAYDIAKSARLKAQRAFDEISTKSPNYAKVKAELAAAKSKEAVTLTAYRSAYTAAKADYNRKTTIDKSKTDAKSSEIMIKSIQEQIKKAQDSGQSTTELKIKLKASENKLTKALELTKKTLEENRPIGVPATAKFSAVTGKWTLGSETWDNAGKKISTPTKGTYTIKNGFTYLDGKIFSGDKDGKTYKYGKIVETPPTGVYTIKNGFTYLDGNLYSGDRDGKTYKYGKIVEKAPTGVYTIKDGLTYLDGKLLSGTKDGKTYKYGKIVEKAPTGVYTIKNGFTYLDGKLLSGTKDGKTYKNGKIVETPTKGVYTTKNGLTYLDGKVLSGTKDGLLYSNGKLFSGKKDNKTYVDGKVQEAPKKITGVYTTKDGLTYLDDELLSGDKDGLLYRDGKLFSGKEDGKTYVNGKVAEGSTPLTPFDEILAKAKETYGDIDSVFNDDADLKQLLRDAIGDVADVNDDMKDSEFLVRLKATTWWATSAGPVRQRGFEKRQYLRLKAEIEKDPTAPDYQKKLDKLENENSYSRGLTNAKGLLKLLINQEGLNVTDEELTKIAGGLYDFANEGNDISRLDALSRFVTANGLTEGPTGKALRSLRATARANGVELDDAAGGNLNTWLQKMFKGKDIADYEQIIRDKAGQTQSKYVKDLLAAGNDLRSIYEPFIREMATSLGIVDINSIDLNDPLLKGAFTENGAINTTQFKNLLRTDKRFINTPAATEEGNVETQASQELARIAKLNGYNLETDFKDQIGGWLERIKNGESLDKISQTIRNKAGEGQSKYVQNQLIAGNNLRSIYATFLNEMAGSFNIDVNAIDINDPLLRGVFTEKGAITLTQFSNLLKADSRFGGTPTAIAEGNAEAQARQQFTRIAQDNGFNIDVDFKDQINGWLARVKNGESIDLVGQAIRDKAADGRGQYVAGLLKSGYNLNGIYGNYINLMSQYFNIDPETISENDPLLQKVFDDKGGLTFAKFEALLRSDERYKGTKYEGQQKDFKQSIADRALTLGVTLGEKEIDEIVNNALSMGISASSTLVDGLIRAKLTYAPGTLLGGAAGGALTKLKSTAAANGIDFDAQFGKDAQTWLSKILQGESTDTYDNIIRQTAGAGLPDNVKALLKLGVNLDTVYAPYKNIMSSVLGLNPETINVNDKTLRSAIGPDKEMTLYDWERSLRKDARWQYTDNARQEVSGVGLDVLQQLGFQG